MTKEEVLKKAKNLPSKIKIYQPETGRLDFLCGFDYPDEWVDLIQDAFEGYVAFDICATCIPLPKNRIR